jgi:hypothetical protein
MWLIGFDVASGDLAVFYWTCEDVGIWFPDVLGLYLH